MSKFNSYAVALDDAFKTARKAYTDAYRNLQDAKKALDASKGYRKEKKVGENERIKREAELAYTQAEQEFENVKQHAWPEYESTVNRLTRELDKAIKENGLASPDAIDEKGLKLLESGVMNADDYAEMLKKYDDNPTMLKFVSKYSRQRADELGNDIKTASERGQLYQIAETAKTGHNSVRRKWDTLTSCGETYSGQKRPNSDAGFVCKMSEHWDEQSMQDAIKSF